jgi:hypothetical protein
MRWVSLGAGAIFLCTLAAMPSVKAGPAMSSAWLIINVSQDECIRRGTAAVRGNTFTTRFEVISNASIYGERGEYTALVRCVAEKGIVYFVVAGPRGETSTNHMNAMRDGF